MDSDDPGDRRLDRAVTLPRRLVLGAWLAVRDFLADRGIDRAAALAYVSLLSLVPLLAALAALYRSFFSTHIERIVEIATAALPYSTDQVEATLGEFVRRATTLGGVGLVVFVIIAFRLFLLIETTLNEVWGTPARRPVTVRIFSFTMIMFWGPVVMGLGSTALFWLERQPWAPSGSLAVLVLRLAIPFVALTMVYWLAPHTGVHIGAAAVGAFVATTGLQLLRWGFVAYIRYFPNINLIFGSLAFVVLFLVSLFAFWTIVILGAEASYVFQNLEVLLREREAPETAQPEPSHVALAVLTATYEICNRRESATLDDLVHGVALPSRLVRMAVDTLLDVGLLAVTGRNREQYVPVADATRLTVGDAAARIARHHGSTPTADHDGALERLAGLLAEADRQWERTLASKTFADLLGRERAAGEAS